MKTRFAMAIALSSLPLVCGSCRKNKNTDAANVPPPVMAPELHQNGLRALPGAVYQTQAASPIHWQPWTKDTLKRAKEARRLVFGVVVMPQHSGFQKVLDSLARNAALVSLIHDHYIPVLIDGDAAREIGLLSADLCSEIKRPLQLPIFLWLTHEGNPVAWIPVSRTDDTGVEDIFRNSHTMVSQMWKDAPDYVLKNSTMDNANRSQRLAIRKNAKVMSNQPATDVLRCIRQLSSLYDPSSRSFDEVGGMFPSGAIELLATAALNPGLAPDVRSRALETTREVLVDLLASAMFDPLDGGVFMARRKVTWALPSFTRDCTNEARVAMSLMHAYRATGDPKVLEKALGIISFAEASYATTEGLFAVGLNQETTPEQWMWSVEEIEKALPPDDAAWWIKATGMKGLGNLPLEADPYREFFRANTLGLAQSPAEIANSLGLSLEAFTPRFEAVKAKLLALRNARFGKAHRDDCSHAGATFRMVSTYASAFGVTGDDRFRQKAVSLLGLARKAFSEGPRLRLFSKEAPASIGAGRAFLYGLALQAVLDVATITSDEHWLYWSEDLATSSAELFTSNEFLKECPDDAKLIDLPVTDLLMLFDESTAGVISSAECRLAEIGRPLVLSFSELATPLPTYAVERPVLHTDLLLATLARHYRTTVVLGPTISPALKLATQRLATRSIQHRPARPDDQLAPDAVKVLLPHGESRTVTTPEALQEAVLPSGGK